MSRRAVFRLSMNGNMANRMIQYMAALKLKNEFPGVVIANVDIPEWGISIPDIPQSDSSVVLPQTHRLDFLTLAKGFETGDLRHVVYPWYAQRVENFLPKTDYEEVFPSSTDTLGWGDEHLVINIRGGEILDGRHLAYVLLPVEFYRYIVDRSGLRPVFVGQIEDNEYARALKAEFPEAIFKPTEGALRDFQTIRQSKHIVPAISTFSWLASWLSDATVHLALAGLINPFQEPELDFIPVGRPSFRYYTFPIMYAVPVANFRESHEHLIGRWRPISENALRQMLAERPRFKSDSSSYLAAFDPRFYLSTYNDVSQMCGQDFDCARAHYQAHGIHEGREAFPFSDTDCARDNADSAEAVGRGDYGSLRDYYVENRS